MIIQTKGDVIRLKGALTENQWPAIRSAVALLLDQHPTGVIIDASGLTEITDAGARTFLDASHFIQAHNARVVVAGMSPELLTEVRKIPGVRSQLAVVSSIEEARKSLESGGATIIPDHKTGPSVLVPLIGSWHEALSYAINQAAAMRAEVHLLYVLQIPRTLPLGVPVPELEEQAEQTLAEAERAAKRRGVRIRKLTARTRDVVEGAAKFATDMQSDLVVLAYSKKEMAQEGGRCAVMNTFCHEVPGDLAILCVKE